MQLSLCCPICPVHFMDDGRLVICLHSSPMNSSPKKTPILVTGCVRSGTTFVANILNCAQGTGLIDEPFNPVFGVQGCDSWFPFLSAGSAEEAAMLTLMRGTIAGRAHYKKRIDLPFSPNPAKLMFRSLFRSRPHFHYQLYRLHPGRCLPIIKDPCACLLSELFHRELNLRTVVMIRRPEAFAASMMRLKYAFDPLLLNRPELMTDEFLHGLLVPEEIPRLDPAERLGLTWACIYKILSVFLERNPHMIAVRHEELCTQPLDTFERLFRKLDLPLTESVRKRIRATTSDANRVEAKDNKVHDFFRNSGSLASVWKSKLTDEQILKIRRITAPIASRFYPAKGVSPIF